MRACVCVYQYANHEDTDWSVRYHTPHYNHYVSDDDDDDDDDDDHTTHYNRW